MILYQAAKVLEARREAGTRPDAAPAGEADEWLRGLLAVAAGHDADAKEEAASGAGPAG